jgi:glycogen(starch) synthase
MTATPKISIVVNTYNRGASLRVTLASLRQLDYPNFEVVVVNGPSTDDTATVLAAHAGEIKAAACEQRNLSMSRNIGVALAAGAIVAFIDDDAYPDPAWLDRLAEAYADDEVAGAGGPVYDHTGAALQTKYLISNRIGQSTPLLEPNPGAWLNVPGSNAFPTLLGTNSSFRRDRLVAIGGFDEEFEFFLDETDVCARIVDAGYVIRQLDDGFVYHKYLPNYIRGDNRVVRDRYSVVKNMCYFALKNAGAGSSFYRACGALMDLVAGQRGDFVTKIGQGLLEPADLEKFDADVPAAFDAALEHFLAGPPKTRSPGWFTERQAPWRAFGTTRRGTDKLHVCLFSQDYPPRPLGGIGRFVHSLATGLADSGHLVHVLTKSAGHHMVDLENGVWVHRVPSLEHPAPKEPDVPAVPAHIWNHAASLLDELRRIDAHRRVDVVQVPNWDAEGMAVLLAGGFRCVVGLYTPMKTLQRIDHGLAADPLAGQIAQCERFCYQRATALLADSEAVVHEIEQSYGITLATANLAVVPLGLPDRAGPPPQPQQPPPSPNSTVTILFVGRLEARKGIDTLLACLPELLAAAPEARVMLVGRDDIAAADGRTYRHAFEASPAGASLGGRVQFLGAVSDEELARLYAASDIVVAPSRFESFGLVVLEAMMFAKPVVAGNVGGVPELVRDGDNGFLVTPGDTGRLGQALAELCRSAELRERFGARSRQIYEAEFTLARMVQRTNAFYDRLTGRSTTTPAP